MENFIKFLIYVAFIIFWVVSNIKKEEFKKQQENNFAKKPSFPNAELPQKKEYEAPLREGALDNSTLEDSFDDMLKDRGYRGIPAQKKETLWQEIDLLKAEEKQKKILTTSNLKKKQTPLLKSSAKEGIIWSVILGQPRAKNKYTRRKPPVIR